MLEPTAICPSGSAATAWAFPRPTRWSWARRARLWAVMIVYGLSASVGIGDLFSAGFLPGLMLATFYVTFVLLRCNLIDLFTWEGLQCVRRML